MAIRLTRKQFIGLGASACAGALLAACGGATATPTTTPATPKPAGEPTKPAAEPTKAAAPTTAPATPQPTKPAAEPAPQPERVTSPMLSNEIPKQFSENPIWAAKVKEGKLPPVKERLPEEPLVVKSFEIGQYGGIMKVGTTGTTLTGWDVDFTADQGYQYMMRISPDFKSVEPNIAKELIVSPDKSTYTIKLRKGMKWSDGAPVTSKDVMFWYEDILQNKDLVPVIQFNVRPQGKLMEVTAPDDYTVVYKFHIPYPVFEITGMAHGYSANYKGAHIQPSHYLKQFHPKYNPKAAEEAKAEKYDNWFVRFSDKATIGINKDLPHLRAHVVVEKSPTRVRFEPNPYFWQVDTAGNQLPYFDGWEMEYLQNLEMYHAKVVTGAYDFAGGYTNILNYQAYEKGAQAGNYRLILWNSGNGGEVYYQVNMNYPDEVLAKLHQDVRYRRALSMAINREEMNDLIYFGKAVPRQITVMRGTQYYKPEYEAAWAEYSPEKANALLDELGLKWNADKTIRLRPDGKPLEYTFDFVDNETPKAATQELVREYWRKVGVHINYKSITRQLLTPRILANEEPVSLWHGPGTGILLPVQRIWTVGTYGDEGTVAPLWNQWYDTKGEKGVEPPAWFKEQQDNFTKFSETMDPAWADKMLKYQADNLVSIGTCGEAPVVLIVRNNLRNVAEYGTWNWDCLWTYPYHSAAWYFKK